MTKVHYAHILVAASFLAVLAGCDSAKDGSDVGSDESNLSETTNPRQGSTIQSPSVSAGKMYWGARSISRLQRLGYLTAVEASVAARADGLIANSPANQMLGVDELAVLELPEHSNSLFPEERAAIPKLWKILTIDTATTVATPAPSVAMTPTETIPSAVTTVPTTTRTAQRIQLTCDSDTNPATLTSADIECAYADRGSYTAAEVAEFRALLREIATAAKATDRSISVPDKTTSSVHQAGGVTVDLDLVPQITGAWSRSTPLTTPSLVVTPHLRFGQIPAGTSVVALDLDSGAESDAQVGNVNINNKLRIEVWTGGTRTDQFDLVKAATAPQPIPFATPVKIGAQTWLMRFESNGMGGYVRSGAVTVPNMPARVYRIAGTPVDRLEMFAEGYGRYVTSASTEFCYPDMSGAQVNGCSLVDANGRARSSIVYATPPTPSDSPAMGYTVGALGHNTPVHPL